MNNLSSGYCSKSILNLRQHLELRSFSVFTVIFMPRVPSRNQFRVLNQRTSDSQTPTYLQIMVPIFIAIIFFGRFDDNISFQEPSPEMKNHE